jgi:putative membrane protein
MMTDLSLAMAHHVLAFLLAAVLAAEFALVRPGLRTADLPLLSRIDGLYGALAMALIVVGIGRVVFGLKGWEYYVYYPVFWAKMAAFAAVGALSVSPTLTIIRWRKAFSAGTETVPEPEITTLRKYLKAEAAFFLLIPILAAMMARGVYS